MFAFPWGESGTRLEDFTGPDLWQEEVLKDLGRDLILINTSEAVKKALRIAVKSGHGVGKTALIAWIILWFISTRPHPQIICTANTKEQLTNKTWRELSKWHKLAVNCHWFDWSATKFSYTQERSTWFASAVPWTKERSEAFAGTHEEHVLVVYDESSLIDDMIWEVTEGAMTTENCMWIAFGNPTRNTGRFKGCFVGKDRHRWKTYTVDARDAMMANQEEIQEWIDSYGEDSDFVRVRALGEFPRASALQFIPEDLVRAAVAREHQSHIYAKAPRIIGADVAWYGDDQSVVVMRQGLDSRILGKYRDIDLMTFASIIMAFEDDTGADAVFIDTVGVGAGVFDRARQLGRETWIPVNVGEKATESDKYFNLRIEIWDRMKEWLQYASIPDDEELIYDLIGPEYGFDGVRNRMQLEKKEDMKKRGLISPDIGDALALTFRAHVTPKWQRQSERGSYSEMSDFMKEILNA
jgi:hypothetical protein